MDNVNNFINVLVTLVASYYNYKTNYNLFYLYYLKFKDKKNGINNKYSWFIFRNKKLFK